MTVTPPMRASAATATALVANDAARRTRASMDHRPRLERLRSGIVALQKVSQVGKRLFGRETFCLQRAHPLLLHGLGLRTPGVALRVRQLVKLDAGLGHRLQPFVLGLVPG